MTKPTLNRPLQRAWVRFDRATAYGCAMRKMIYDDEVCRLAWTYYNALAESFGIAPFMTPFASDLSQLPSL